MSQEQSANDVSSDAAMIFKLQEKLDTLKSQVHSWKASAKVFEESGSYNFDLFLKGPNTPKKRAKKSKTIGSKQEWKTLNMAQQYEILQQVAAEHTRVTLNFNGLGLALKTAITSSTLKASLAPDSLTDEDERTYLLDLIEEQRERSESILNAEDERLNRELELLALKCELAREFGALKEGYTANLEQDNFRENLISGEQDLVKQKEKLLETEEKRLTQMKTLIQKLLMSVPNGCLNFEDEAVCERNKEMLMKCGQDIETLRQEKKKC